MDRPSSNSVDKAAKEPPIASPSSANPIAYVASTWSRSISSKVAIGSRRLVLRGQWRAAAIERSRSWCALHWRTCCGGTGGPPSRTATVRCCRQPSTPCRPHQTDIDLAVVQLGDHAFEAARRAGRWLDCAERVEDPLFVRNARTLAPTPLARSLRETLAAALTPSAACWRPDGGSIRRRPRRPSPWSCAIRWSWSCCRRWRGSLRPRRRSSCARCRSVAARSRQR